MKLGRGGVEGSWICMSSATDVAGDTACSISMKYKSWWTMDGLAARHWYSRAEKGDAYDR